MALHEIASARHSLDKNEARTRKINLDGFDVLVDTDPASRLFYLLGFCGDIR
jgi:hypothetical protein